MPLHDCAPWVSEAITSVLEKADSLLELIVVDDGSEDTGPEIAGAFGEPVRVLRRSHEGPAAARNAGIVSARGELIGFLDADDLWTAGSPDPRIAALDDDPALQIAVGLVQPATAGLVPYGDPKPGVLAGAVIARATVFAGHGGLDESRIHGEDVDWMQRMREAGLQSRVVQATTCLYRRRDGSLTRSRTENRQAIAGLIHDSLKRRGAI